MMMSGFTIEILPHGYVRYIDHLGTDRRIVEAARVSYGGASKGEEADKKLLEYLFKMRHTSPFEQCNVTFNIKMPIFVMRQFVRHRTFRLNECSGRYSELKDEFYLPQIWREQDHQNKQGSLPPRVMDSHEMMEWQEMCSKATNEAYVAAFDAYDSLLKYGVAKELARIVLPVGVYTEIYVNVDLHNMIHFFNLRLDPHAQKEIRDVAWAMLSIAEHLFPWTIAMFDKYKPVMEQKDKIRIHG
jgi:thymidylate synthase (FAD)